ncbi:MAG: hypothetical protein ACJ77B_06340 [Chloroflexota bacterium]
MSASAAVAARPNPVRLTWLLGLIVALAVAGAVVAVQGFTRPTHQAANGVISTTFGSIALTDFRKLDGLTADDLNGMTHGVGGLVGANQVELRVGLRIANASDHAVKVDPAEFTLTLPGAKSPLPPATTTFDRLTLLPGSTVDATLAFVAAPSTGAALLTYSASGETSSIEAGQVVAGSPRPDAGHTH